MDPISDLMKKGRAEGVFPGAVLWVQKGHQVVYRGAWGDASLAPVGEAMTLDTLFYVVSLTKVMATTTAILRLFDTKSKGLNLEMRVGEILPGMRGEEKGALTLRLLLSHSSGLPDTRPYYQIIQEEEKRSPGFLGSPKAKERIFRLVHEEPLVYLPGTKQMYSDLGFILLGEIVERVTGEGLDQFCRREVFDRFGMPATGFRPLSGVQQRLEKIAATEQCPWRGKILRGEVQDDNSYVMGGVAGHAGLFSTASDVGRFAMMILAAWHGEGAYLNPERVREFTARQSPEWGLGWMMRSEPSSSGRFFSDASFGHLGYTGTSLWIDPSRDLIVVFLTNRVHPSRDNDKIRAFRPLLHDRIVEEVGRG